MVNPWGIYDRKSEYPRGCYTENPLNPLQHPRCRCRAARHRCRVRGRQLRSVLSRQSLRRVGSRPIAQHLGRQFTRARAHRRCRSCRRHVARILLTGPGAARLGAGHNKPDLCATSQFREDDDAFSVNTGTSAACGLTAGIVAALRSRWDTTTVPPNRLRQILNQAARKPVSVPWSRSLRERLGHGVLDAKEVFDELAGLYP